jgi:hypothetical protein
MPEDTIEDRIARRVVELLDQRKFKIEACRTVQAVRNPVRTGQIPAVRGDRKVQIRRVDIDSWVAGSVERI